MLRGFLKGDPKVLKALEGVFRGEDSNDSRLCTVLRGKEWVINSSGCSLDSFII